MQFDSQRTQYISTNFIEEKSTDEESYKSVVRIFDTTIIFPFATFLVVSYLAFSYSNRIVIYAIEHIKGDNEKDKKSSKSLTMKSVFITLLLVPIKQKLNSLKQKLISLKDKVVNKCRKTRHGYDSINCAGQDEQGTTEGQDSKQDTTQNGKQDSKQDTTQNGKQDSKQDTTQNGKQDSKQDTTQNGKQDSKQDTTQNGKQDSKQDTTQNGKQDSKQDSKPNSIQDKIQHRRIRIFSLSLTSMLLCFALLAFQIMASLRVIEYGNEVLYDKDNDRNSKGDINSSNGTVTEHDGDDDQCIPIIYVVFSFFPSVSLILVLFLSLILIGRSYNLNNEDEDLALGLFLQVSLGGFLVYLGAYFLPYMLLAFINDPIKTIFIYIMGASSILCLCLLTYSLCFSINSSLLLLKKRNFPGKLILIPSTWQLITWYLIRHPYLTGSGASLAYFLIIVIFLLRLGNFNDFQAAHNLTLPIIAIVISIFVLKPFYKYIFQASKEDDVTKLTKEMQQLIKKIDPLITQTNNTHKRARSKTL